MIVDNADGVARTKELQLLTIGIDASRLDEGHPAGVEQLRTQGVEHTPIGHLVWPRSAIVDTRNNGFAPAICRQRARACDSPQLFAPSKHANGVEAWFCSVGGFCQVGGRQ
ncbi:MAG: hypothetical protein E5W21_00665, partial [Mesorhizobium sp.]